MARLQAADIPLRRATSVQWARRACLTLSLLFAVVVPWLHNSSVVGAPWSVRLFGLEIFDPLAVLSLLAARVASPSLVWGALPALLLVLWLGRYFCSWICPYALVVGASNTARSLLARLGVPTLDLQLPRRWATVVLVVLLVVTALSSVQVSSLVYPPAVINRALFKWVTVGSAGAGALVIGALFLFDTFISRAGFCRSLCPGGACFRALSWRSPVKVVRDTTTCTSCKLCDAVCNMGQHPMTDGEDGGCDRCTLCVSVCPHDSLQMTHGLVTLTRRKRA